jgi:hypothetical protein
MGQRVPLFCGCGKRKLWQGGRATNRVDFSLSMATETEVLPRDRWLWTILYSATVRRRLDWGALTLSASHSPGNGVCSVEGIAAYGDLLLN